MIEKLKQIEHIRKACIEANPEIVELKFGCEIEQPLKSAGYRVGRIASFSGSDDGTDTTSYYHVMFGMSVDKVYVNEFKIIGRPIRLSDVLLAVKQEDLNLENKFKKDYKGHPPIKYKIFYQFMQSITKYEIDGGEFWNLKDDNLEHQTPETIAFIFNLLKNE